MEGDLKLFDERLGKRRDALFAVLIASDDLQFFPEMAEIFGRDQVVKFLDIFAGQTITVPPREVLESKITDVQLWMELSERPSELGSIAHDFELTVDEVLERAKSVGEKMKSLGIVFRANM